MIRRSQEEKTGGGTKAALLPKGRKARWLARGSLLENHTFCK
ncbi:hypothetical protein LEP1GSC191_1324 [Leptospira borgpetersenii serovar Mini str. 201000851]|uniref:Uncharacterized protein n=1 Tax=Leptospira borgpetersenii serovar Ballum TaxID=280505 RepID=A0A0S2IUU4_LEPBO|nr:hypothetical protein LBBP_03220 [Leptospira borgpetersenii serovar Ballum]ENO64197.1 hypothetical protein LEP1GSC191_1324 [Leptospira borgpetersenii serovar Mini str. 201000851]